MKQHVFSRVAGDLLKQSSQYDQVGLYTTLLQLWDGQNTVVVALVVHQRITKYTLKITSSLQFVINLQYSHLYALEILYLALCVAYLEIFHKH